MTLTKANAGCVKAARRVGRWLALLICVWGLAAQGASLQGQNKGDTTNWVSVNLEGWLELEYIPFRLYFNSGSAGVQNFTVTFSHLSGTTPGFEDLVKFKPFSTNLVFVSAPVLSTDPSGTWSYSFTVNVLDSQPAELRFFARLAAGSHANVGSSLQLRSNAGNVQVHKPGVTAGTPDLSITKTGPGFVLLGGSMSYSLVYSNKTGVSTSLGTQVSDILPAWATVDTNSLPANAHLVGSTIFWDLGDLAGHARGVLSFQVTVQSNAPVGSVLTNFAQILSSQDESDLVDNTSTWLTTVTNICISPDFGVNPASDSWCPGETASFSAVVSGTAPFTYQWRKDGTNLAGATGNTLCVSSLSAADVGQYDLVVSNACGTKISSPAQLSLNQGTVVSSVPVGLTNCPGSTAVFAVTATGQMLGYRWYKSDLSAPGQLTLLTNRTANSLVLSNLTAADGGLYSVVVTGNCGEPLTNSAPLVVTSLPALTCAGNKTVEAGQAWDFDVPSVTNGTLSVVSTVTNTAGHCGNTFDVTRTWAAVDACGNSAQCSQTVTVVDTTAPVMACSTNKAVQLGSAWSFDPPTVTDNGGANWTLSAVSTVTNTVGHCGNTFDATRTWAAVDACGNSAQCSQTVKVVDTTAPVMACSTNKAVRLGTLWSFDPPTVTDNDGTNWTLSVVSTVTNTAGHCGETFDATRTWVAVDACGNSAQCSQTVNVVVTMPPTISCSTNKTVSLGSVWNFDEPTVTDNGETNWTLNVVSTVTNTAGHCGNTFDVTRTWAAVDVCGFSAQCSQTVMVVDTVAPVMACSTNKTVQLGVLWGFDPPTVTDDGGTNWTLSVVSTVTNRVGHCGNTFEARRTWAAVDACGNSAECSQTVTVVDTTAPVMACSTNKTVQLGSAWSFDPPSVTDNDGTNWTLNVVSTVTNTVGHCGGTFDATRTWAAVDACGNSAECSQTVTVVDTTAPVMACSTNKTVQLGSAWSFDVPSVTDNDGTNWTLNVVSTVTNRVGHCGSTFEATRTWAAVDACGNAAECSQTVSLVDTAAPVMVCSPNKTIQLGSAWSFDVPSVTDNDGTNWTLSVVSTVTNTVGHCGNAFDATRTWAAVDACGNAAECSQTVTVADTAAPVMTCGTNKTVQAGVLWSFDPPTVTDNDGTNWTLSVVSTVTNTVGHCGNTFDATRTWAAVDACGNAAECSQTVTVVDTVAPVMTCGTNKTVQLGALWSFDSPTATDNGGTNWTLSVVSTVTNTVGYCGGTFDATRTWAAVDACGNAAECSQTVTVVDTMAPVIACSTNKTVELGSAWSFDVPSVTDNDGTNWTLSVVSTVTNRVGHCGGSFDATRTWAAVDACGNSAQCSQSVTVLDTTAPVIICSLNKAVELGSAWSFDPPSVTDNDGTNWTLSVVGTVTNTVGYYGGTFEATRTWVAVDACGNSAQCSQMVSVVDTTAPVVACRTNKTVELGTPWSFDPPSVTDNDGTNWILRVVSTTTNRVGHCGSTFETTQIWAAVDSCGNSAECSQTVTVVDTTAPTLGCGTNKTIQLGSAWSFDPPTVTDNDGTNWTLSVVSTVTNTVGYCGNTFDATRTWMAVDACGNSAQCSQTVKVIDTTVPVVACSTNKTVQLGTVWSFDPPSVTDNDGTNWTLSVVSTVTNTAGHCGNTFDATRTWAAVDACGNSAQCSQTVTVIDTTAPVIACSTNKTVQLGTVWSFDMPTVTDNDGTNWTLSVVTTVTNTTGHCGNTFDATRTWAAVDACGNSAQCSQTVTVVDTTAPLVACSTNKTVQLGTLWSFDPPSVTDNGGTNWTLNVVSTVTNTVGHCGNTFDATRTWAAVDACGNSAQCSQTVTVIDTTAPVIACSTNKTVQLGTVWSFDLPSVTDNDGTNWTLSVASTVTNRVGHCGGSFDATRTWVAVDACGNSAQCSQTVTVIDTTAPVIACSTNKTVQLGTLWSFDVPSVTDNDGTNWTLSVVSTVTNRVGYCGNTFDATRTWVAVDACGNSAQCSQIVTVIDTTAPVIACSTNKTVQLGTLWSFDAPSVTDNDRTNWTLSVASTVTNRVGHCGGSFDATRTWAAVDACGNSAQCSQTVTVVDTLAPVITCSTNKAVQLGAVWSFDPPSVTDNDGTNWTLNVVSTVTNRVGYCGNTFDATRTWAAIDACGNSAQCSQTVTVIDTTAPVIACSTNKTVQLGTLWSFDPPSVTDNDGTNWTLNVVSTVTNRVGYCGNTFDATRTWAAVDACGNSAQCSQIVTVIDTTAPVIACSTNKTVQLGVVWSFDPPSVTDNGGTNWTLSVVSTVTNRVGYCGNTFDATRTWAAIDACGNSAQCSQTVTVIDTTAPVIACSTNKTVQLGAVWSFDPPSVTDNGGTNWTLSVVSTVTNRVGRCGNTFDATRTWAAVDACGNAAQCSQTVTVVDTLAPVIACSTNKTVQLGVVWSFDPPSVTDNGGTNWTLSVVSTVTNRVGHCGNTFDATRTWMAVDACGNSAACSQTVTVVDTTAPVIVCSTNKAVQLGAVWSFDPPSVTDNDGTNWTLSVVSTVTNRVGYCGNTFDATRTWAAVDACGNSAQCSQTVTVIDTTAPVIVCSTNKTVQLGAKWSFDPPTVTDNDGTNWTLSVTSTVTNRVGHCGNTFDATRTWMAVDACGNSAACSQTVTVIDTTAPVIVCSTNKTVQLGTVWSFDAPTVADNDGTNWTLSVVSTVTNTVGHCGNSFDATRTWAAVDACGNSAQCSQTVTVVDPTPILIVAALADQSACLGTAANFEMVATGTSLNYLWSRNGVALGTNSSLLLTNVSASDAGLYQVVVSDACGDAVTNAATLTVNQPLRVLSSPVSLTNCPGTSASFSVVATGTGVGYQWYKSSSYAASPVSSLVVLPPPGVPLSGQTNSSLVLASVSGLDAGTYTVVVSGTCGNAVTNSAYLAVNVPAQILTPLVDQVTCAGTTSSLGVSATGTGLVYHWLHNGLVVGTNNLLVLTNVQVADAGRYEVLVTGSCGNVASNSASLTVNPATAVAPLGNPVQNLGETVTFTAVASGTGPLSYAWRKDGVLLAGATTASLTLTNVGFADGGVYAVEVTGPCGTVTQAGTLRINHPPTVSLVSPTNTEIFIAPANLTLLADARDVDGVVTNVQFFVGATNALGQTPKQPAFLVVTNVGAGTYTFSARASDDLGASGEAAPVTVTVLERPPLSVVSALRLDAATGLFKQTVRVSNPTSLPLSGVRVYISNLLSGQTVYNATGYSNGVAYVQSAGAVSAGGYVDFVISYYVTNGKVPAPVLRAEVTAPLSGGLLVSGGLPCPIRQGRMMLDQTFLLDFDSQSNRIYYVQYTSDLTNWKTVPLPLVGTGYSMRWVDEGQPSTESAPSATARRFYRLIQMP